LSEQKEKMSGNGLNTFLILMFVATLAFLIAVVMYTLFQVKLPETQRHPRLVKFFDDCMIAMVAISAIWMFIGLLYAGVIVSWINTEQGNNFHNVYDPVTGWFCGILTIIYIVCGITIITCFHEYHPDIIGTERYNLLSILLRSFLIVTIYGTLVTVHCKSLGQNNDHDGSDV